MPFEVSIWTAPSRPVVLRCRRLPYSWFNWGLAMSKGGKGTLHPYFNSFRVRSRIDAVPSTPDDEDVEKWLDYVFSRNEEMSNKYKERVQVVQKQLIEGLTR